MKTKTIAALKKKKKRRREKKKKKKRGKEGSNTEALFLRSAAQSVRDEKPSTPTVRNPPCIPIAHPRVWIVL
jgi:hypothetical protein